MRYRNWPVSLVFGAAMAAFGNDGAPPLSPLVRNAIATEMRSWSSENMDRNIEKRPKPFAREKGVYPLPRGIWLRDPSSVGRRPGPAAKRGGKSGTHSQTYRDFREDLLKMELSRSDDGAMGDYRLVLQEAAQAARSNQHINYVPIIISSLEFGVLDARNQTASGKAVYFRALPHKGRQFSQLITFGLEPGFVLNNLGKDLVSLTLTIGGKSYPLTMGSAAPVAFENPGIHAVSVQARFEEGITLSSEFEIEIRPLDDGTYANSRVDSSGSIRFKM